MPKIEILQNQKQTGRATKISKIYNIFRKKTTIIYTLMFCIIVSIAFIGRDNNENKVNNSNINLDNTSVASEAAPKKTAIVDEVTESGVLASLAESANLAVAPNAASFSISTALLQEAPQLTGVLEKPKIIEVSSEKREIVKYTTVAEESIQSIADKYGITAQTIKWVNALKGDAVEAGKELRILPVDGIVYTVKVGDTLKTIAEKYQVSVERIVSYNELKEDEELKEGVEIVIPGGILPEEDRPDYVAPVQRIVASSTSSVNSSITVLSANYNAKAGNAYAGGNCTWYAFNRRPDIGSFWGDARTWDDSARAAGYRVDKIPEVGSIAQWEAYASSDVWGYGHVAIVESINGDGTITISEMNYAGRLYTVTTRTISVSNVSNFIH